ncbi:MAG: glycoside hydrolase family 2 protein [Halobacteriaceae archaeon]
MTRDAIDLSGDWTVRLDPDREGREAAWYDDPLDGESVRLPGALRESGVGPEVGPDTDWVGRTREDAAERYAPYRDPENFKVPHWLQPERHYVGAAWYERTASVPDSWADRSVTLRLERPHWHTTVWVDGERVGEDASLSTPHEYDLTEALSPGEHRLTVRVDNSLEPVDVGLNSHSVSDHTQTAWHGVVGDLSLRATAPTRIEDLQVYPSAADRSARVALRVETRRDEPAAADVELSVEVDDGATLASERLAVTVPPDGADVETTLDLDGAPTWDAFDPELCALDATVGTAAGADRERVRFGLRDVETEGTRVVVNDRPVTLRGTLECCVFPETGYPPTGVEEWREVLRTFEEHGLNHVRFHSWCPPEAAFEAADELGFYLQVECSSWANGSTSLGEGEPVDDWLYEEGERVLDAYANHPSLLLFAYGNEPGGNDEAYLAEWVSAFEERAERCLVTGGSGWPLIDENEFHVTPEPRIHAWGAGLDDRLNGDPPATTADYGDVVERYPETPTVAHESGQWCAYPNFEEVEKYTGQLRPRNFEIFRDLLDEAGMLDQAREFLRASGELQELCYEEEVESALRTPGMAGFQLLMLHDFPGQGTALVGMLDAFFDAKPYHDVERFRASAGPVVPLARLDRRTFTADQTLSARLEVSQFGPRDLADARVEWDLTGPDGDTVAAGTLDAGDLPTGGLRGVGEVEAPLDEVEAPTRLTLTARVVAGDAAVAANDWDVWVYPPAVDTSVPAGVTLATAFDERARERLRDGETVVLFADPETVATDVELGFSPVFWNTAWTDGQAPHTLGLLPDADHPALAAFPTDDHTDWQWWGPVASAATMELDDLPDGLRPVVQVVPDWFDPKKLALVFEAGVGAGRLLVSSVDLTDGLADRPAARQLRHSLLRYAASDAFDPDESVSADAVADLFE